jgi:hypothetical protein
MMTAFQRISGFSGHLFVRALWRTPPNLAGFGTPPAVARKSIETEESKRPPDRAAVPFTQRYFGARNAYA